MQCCWRTSDTHGEKADVCLIDSHQPQLKLLSHTIKISCLYYSVVRIRLEKKKNTPLRRSPPL